MPIFLGHAAIYEKRTYLLVQGCIIYRSLQIQLPVDNSVFIASNDISGLGNLFFQICDVIERVNRQARTFKESLQWSDTTISNVRLHDLFFLFDCFCCLVCLFVFSYQNEEKRYSIQWIIQCLSLEMKSQTRKIYFSIICYV